MATRLLITRKLTSKKRPGVRAASILFCVSMLALMQALAQNPASAQTPDAPSIIPFPAHYQMGDGSFALKTGAFIVVPRNDKPARQTAEYLASLMRRTRDLTLHIRSDRYSGGIHLERCAQTKPSQAYHLAVTPDHVTICAADAPGLFYGAVSLWQLATTDGADHGAAEIPGMTIDDSPRFQWRGLMLDSARHYQSPQFVMNLIDWMALHKLNVLHWHLTDDQAWRLEIKRDPRLTSVGAWRQEAGAAAASDIDPATGKPRLYGGVYTQDEVRKIVAFAQARNVMIVPEIEMPGHATAAIAAYPELASSPDAPSVPSHDWGVHANLLNTDDTTLTFMENVLTEVMALFPSTYIHVGGDEATKDQWKASAAEQAKIHSLGLADEDALQAWYTQQIDAFLTAHNRRLIGWDEILKGGLSPNATVMSWHGSAGAIAAAKSGHDAILAPKRPLYLNYRQSDSPDEPPGRAPLNTLEDIYRFDPISKDLTTEQSQHVLGVQAALWTEYVRTDDRVEHMLFPRLAALAEVAWSPAASHDWDGFKTRLVPQMARYRSLGIKAADSAFAVRIAGQDSGDNTGKLILSNQLGFGTIHYTLDGSAPDAGSPIYSAPIDAKWPTTVMATTFAGDKAVVPPTRKDITLASLHAHSSAELDLCKSPDNAIVMEDDWPLDGPRATFLVNYTDRCWIYRDAPLDAVAKAVVRIGSIPFNLHAETNGLRRSSDGQTYLELRADKVDGPLLGKVMIDSAAANPGLTTFDIPITQVAGRHDVFLVFTQGGAQPIWTIDTVSLQPAAPQP